VKDNHEDCLDGTDEGTVGHCHVTFYLARLYRLYGM